jgi:hypothetical protein
VASTGVVFGEALIAAEVERTRQEFADSRVRRFIPVLVQRRVADTLRHKLVPPT